MNSGEFKSAVPEKISYVRFWSYPGLSLLELVEFHNLLKLANLINGTFALVNCYKL